MNEELHKCGNPKCARRVRLGVTYCCGMCSVRDKSEFKSSTALHTTECNSRHEVRGEWKDA